MQGMHAPQHSLRFFGSGTAQTDRVKVTIAAPDRPADVGGDLGISCWSFGIGRRSAGSPLPGAHAVASMSDDATFKADYSSSSSHARYSGSRGTFGFSSGGIGSPGSLFSSPCGSASGARLRAAVMRLLSITGIRDRGCMSWCGFIRAKLPCHCETLVRTV